MRLVRLLFLKKKFCCTGITYSLTWPPDQEQQGQFLVPKLCTFLQTDKLLGSRDSTSQSTLMDSQEFSSFNHEIPTG